MQNKKIFLILQGKNLVENVGYVPGDAANLLI